MKKILFLITCILFVTISIYAQNTLNEVFYQSTAKAQDGKILSNQALNLKLNLKNIITNEIYYSEAHQVNTDQFGLFSLVIGEGKTLSGDFAAIPWGSGAIWLETLADAGNEQIFREVKLFTDPSIYNNDIIGNVDITNLNVAANVPPYCLGPSCRCEGGISEMQLYYLGPDPVNIDVYNSLDLVTPFTSRTNITNGDSIIISAATLSNGVFAYYTYFKVTNLITGDECINRIYSQCPRNVWPGSLSDLQILGKRYGDIFVYGYTSSAQNQQCDISNIEQDWKVGGNIVAPDNMKLGTINNEPVSIITNNLERGVISKDGNFGFGTNAPLARVHVGGNARITDVLDVFGVTTIHNITNSTNVNNGALVVNGGVGVGLNLNIGQNLDVTGTTFLRNNLTVGASGLTRLQNLTASTNSNTGALVVAGGTGIGGNLNVAGMGHFDGKVTIGTNNMPILVNVVNTSNYSLFVADGILTEEVLVNVGWADHVFNKDYPLKKLEEVETHIQEKGYLPDTPSAQEIEENGLKLGEATVNQQIKIEELFLYLIELNKEVKQLKQENKQLQAKVQELEKR
ncbi:MAG: hypothetical protein SFU99_22645 [Saprospiraceae bacterium]|nr:hypothetical protein [Saprospiraceae bacterium]